MHVCRRRFRFLMGSSKCAAYPINYENNILLHPGRAPENFQCLKHWRHYLRTLVERIMVSYQNEAHLVYEFFFRAFSLA